ncbi:MULTISPECIES: hypothetical protein, partial [Escherichia]|uniref:hypothetical protein n=1 Tax=Escherichia TaxID=561 RepID=UPI0019D475D2
FSKGYFGFDILGAIPFHRPTKWVQYILREGLSRFSPLLTPRLLMSARPHAMLSLMQFCLPRAVTQNAATT